MADTYRIHFGYSKRSKNYPQAVELANLAHKHEVLAEGADTWHIVTFTPNQADLMAYLYSIAVKLPKPKVYGADIQYMYVFCLTGGTYDYAYASQAKKERVKKAVRRLQDETGKSIKGLADHIKSTYLEPVEQDMSAVREKLISEGRIDYVDSATQELVKAQNPPQEPLQMYKEIRELIRRGNYEEAVEKYYSTLGDRHYGELTPELIYLKRLAGIPLSGRDLLYFRPKSTRDVLVESHTDEYVACIDDSLAQLREHGRNTPIDILLKFAPTMGEMIQERKHKWHKGVYLWDGKFQRDSTPVTLDGFSTMYDSAPEGRLFDRYPDQVRHCRIKENQRDTRYMGLWTKYPPFKHRTEIVNNGLHLAGIEAYRHKAWREYGQKPHREPDFTSLKTLDAVSKSNYATEGIEYTGRTHRIRGQRFYEINLVRYQGPGEEIENPFLELIQEILRESENLLRERHGIPRIGEGWVSETKLFRLVQSAFPDALQHASPPWLSPQHLDVFVPSKSLAFEYQGRQHFEPVDFFGGKESFEATVRRDRLKTKKCRDNQVVLIHWKYTEPIDELTLKEKLGEVGIRVS